MRKRSKAFLEIKQKVKSKSYTLEQALDFLLKNKRTKFDETIELHINLNIKKGKEKLPFRIIINPPYPLGKIPKIAVLGKTKIKHKNLISNPKDILKQIKNQKIDFDILIASSEFISELSPYAKFLGPKGLMPNQKNQTLTEKPGEVIKKILKGQREIKVDDQDILHIPCGKSSLGITKIKKNIEYIISQIKQNRPQGIKGDFIQTIHISSTMGPSLKVEDKILS